MYAKLFSRITESSLMEETPTTRFVFMAMLAIANRDGLVIGTNITLARRLNIPLKDLEDCLDRLLSPDPNSNTPDLDGRRIVKSDGEKGYVIVNYVKYRSIRDEESRKEYMREYMREYMQDKRCVKHEELNVKQKVSNIKHSESNIKHMLDTVNTVKTCLANAEAEADTEADIKIVAPAPRFVEPTLDEVRQKGKEIGLPENDCEAFFNYYGSNGWRVGKNKMKNWHMAIAGWKNRRMTQGQLFQITQPKPAFNRGFIPDAK